MIDLGGLLRCAQMALGAAETGSQECLSNTYDSTIVESIAANKKAIVGNDQNQRATPAPDDKPALTAGACL